MSSILFDQVVIGGITVLIGGSLSSFRFEIARSFELLMRIRESLRVVLSRGISDGSRLGCCEEVWLGEFWKFCCCFGSVVSPSFASLESCLTTRIVAPSRFEGVPDVSDRFLLLGLLDLRSLLLFEILDCLEVRFSLLERDRVFS